MSGVGKQIEEYERPYQIVYGEDGGEAQVVHGTEGPDWPIWRAPRMVVALLTKQIERAEGEEAEELAKIRQAFKNADTGEVIWGMIRKWRNKKGKTRFIGLIQKGQHYREAGTPPTPSNKGFVPSLSKVASLNENDRHLSTGVPPKAPAMSEAERIADKMAKASRKAVEDDATAP